RSGQSIPQVRDWATDKRQLCFGPTTEKKFPPWLTVFRVKAPTLLCSADALQRANKLSLSGIQALLALFGESLTARKRAGLRRGSSISSFCSNCINLISLSS